MKQRGVSLLAVLLAIIVVAVVAWLGISSYTNYRDRARMEKAEADAVRGIAPSTSPDPAKPAASARERADQLQSAEAAADFKGLMDPAAYRALSTECQKVVDTIVGLLDKPEESAAFKQRLAESESRFSANCVDRAAEAKASAASDSGNSMETRQRTCKLQRDAAAEYSSVISMTLNDGPDKPGVVDEDKKSRRASLDENRKRLQEVEAYIAANC